MTFDFSWATLVQFLLAIVLPLLVGIVTTKTQSGLFRAVILSVLTLATTLLTTLLAGLTGTPVEWFTTLLTALGSFVISVASHFGVWRAQGKDGESISAKLIHHVGVGKD